MGDPWGITCFRRGGGGEDAPKDQIVRKNRRKIKKSGKIRTFFPDFLT